MCTWSSAVMVVLSCAVTEAQAFQFRTPPPDVSAAMAAWQVSNEPIIVQGLAYLPTREFRLFDGQVMVQVGIYQGVPVYADATLEVYSLVYVPVGAQRMRTYERVRDRELAGTTGSRTPTFPVRSPSAAPPEERIVATAGTLAASAVGAMAIPSVPGNVLATGRTVESIPRPTGADGVWLYFNGRRYYSAGPAVPFSNERFRLIGQHEGFPVYQETSGNHNQIWVAVVNGGPVAPYEKR
jgi:hypothetical protein